MLDRFRGTHITWTHANQRLPSIEAHSGDVNGRRLIAQIKDDEIAADVSNCDLYLLWKCGETDKQDQFSFEDGVFFCTTGSSLSSRNGTNEISRTVSPERYNEWVRRIHSRHNNKHGLRSLDSSFVRRGLWINK